MGCDGWLTLCWHWSNVRRREFCCHLGIGAVHFAVGYTLHCELSHGVFQSLRTGVTSPENRAGNWGALSNEGQGTEDGSNFCSWLNQSSKYRTLFRSLDKCVYAVLRSHSTLVESKLCFIAGITRHHLLPLWQNWAIRYIKWFSWPLHMSEFRECSCNKKDIYTQKFWRAYLIFCCVASLKRDLDRLWCSHV